MAETQPMQSEDQQGDGVFFVSMSYKGTSYEVPVQAEDFLVTIFDFVAEALDFPRENCKLIHRGKVLRPDNDSVMIGEAGLSAGSKVMLVASSAKDVSLVQSSRADPLVKGFAEEERDEQSRRKRAKAAMQSAWGTKQDTEFNFGSIKAEFKYSEPPPYEAERLLQRLATDPGIIEIMKTNKFKVGVLTEMSPVEATERMAKKGTPNMDLLGYNQNYGGMIVLKLRTDSLKGFRPYHDLINTLIHEMTHNVWGPHDNNFWKLFGELKAQYMRFHRFWSHGGRAADSMAGGQFQGFTGDDEDGQGSFGKALGSTAEAPTTEAERKARAAAAAESRAIVKGLEDKPDKPVPNFLASNGKWMFLCPCGETHEVENNICPVAASAGKASGSSAQGGAKETNEGPSEDAETEQAGYADADAHSEAAEVPEEAVPAVSSSAPAPVEDETMPDVVVPAVSSSTPSEERPPVVESDGDIKMADADKAALDDAPQLDLAELQAQGLDGASLWLQRFSTHLKALCRPEQHTARAAAVELLLRLVNNVVHSPEEPKFRRIRADNPKIQANLIRAGGEAAEALMVMLGFEATTENNERVFLLRDATFDTARLRMGQEVLEMELEKMGTAAAR